MSQATRKPNSKKKHIYKIILLGSQGAGKSKLIHKMLFNKYDAGYVPTICPEFYIHETNNFIYQFWDTTGNSLFEYLNRGYYRGCDICILIYDITDLGSFEDIEKWKKWYIECQANKKKLTFMVVAAKADLYTNRGIQTIKVQQWFEQPDFATSQYMEVSAKNDYKINDLFELIQTLCSKQKNKDNYSANLIVYKIIQNQSQFKEKPKKVHKESNDEVEQADEDNEEMDEDMILSLMRKEWLAN